MRSELRDCLRETLLRLVPYLVRCRSAADGQARSILLIRPDHLGDVLFTTPALRLLRSHLPEVHISMLVGPWARDVLRDNANVDRVLTWDFPWFNRRAKSNVWEPYLALARLARRLREQRFDAAINLRFDFWWGALAAYLADIPRRVGYDINSCRPFLTHRYDYRRGVHEVERNIELIQRFLRLPEEAVRSTDLRLEFRVAERDQEFAADYLVARGVSVADMLLGLHPGSGSPAKQWDAGRFAAVGRHLARTHNCRVMITGSENERRLAETIAGGIGRSAIIAAGDTPSLGQLAALYWRCRLVIGVDSGPMHLAVAVGVPTVHLYGPSDHVAFGPFGNSKQHKVVRANMPCSPCGKFDFTAREPGDCMRAISVEEVINAAEALLAVDTARR